VTWYVLLRENYDSGAVRAVAVAPTLAGARSAAPVPPDAWRGDCAEGEDDAWRVEEVTECPG
jgi:hypothetical protein